MSCDEWLRTLGLSRLERRRLRGNPVALCSFLRRRHISREVVSSSPGIQGQGQDPWEWLKSASGEEQP